MRLIIKISILALLSISTIGYTPVQATEFGVSSVDFSLCEQAIKNGRQLANTSSSYENASYWFDGDRYFRLKISSLNMFSVKFSCEELLANQ